MVPQKRTQDVLTRPSLKVTVTWTGSRFMVETTPQISDEAKQDLIGFLGDMVNAGTSWPTWKMSIHVYHNSMGREMQGFTGNSPEFPGLKVASTTFGHMADFIDPMLKAIARINQAFIKVWEEGESDCSDWDSFWGEISGEVEDHVANALHDHYHALWEKRQEEAGNKHVA